jgi:hypothetical protein
MASNKKAQLAIFMILGITAVMLIGLAVYGAGNADSDRLSSKQKQIEELFIGKGKYTTYIRSCLDQATKQGLYLIGQQGGVIYETDNYRDASLIGYNDEESLDVVGGSTSKAFYEVSNGQMAGLKIHYGLMAPTVSTTEENGMLKYPFASILPEQPFLGVNPELTYDNSKPFFNVLNNPLIRLCDKLGPNSIKTIDQDTGEVNEAVECGSGLYMYGLSNNNVQEYLQYYITQKTDECIQLSALPELQGYDVQKENVDVKVIMGESSVTSKLNMNLSITKNETLPKIEISELTIEKKVRLLKVFQTLQDIIIEDSKNIFYDIKDTKPCGSELQGEACLTSYLVIEKEPITTGPNKGDWIVKITDTNSLIGGKEFTYQVVFQNRYPVLDYITFDGVELNPAFSDYDAVLVEGQKLIIHPYGYDPDEDNHDQEGYMKNSTHYEYIGEYKEFNSDPGDLGDPVCTPTSSASLTLMKTKIDSCSSLASLPSAFDSNNVFELDLKERHAGEHNIKVSVCDPLGQCDYQILKLFVFPMSTYAGSGSIPDYNYNLHTFAGKKPYLSDPGQTLTLGINNAVAVSYTPTQPQDPQPDIDDPIDNNDPLDDQSNDDPDDPPEPADEDKKMIVVVDKGATKENYEVYLISNDYPGYPQVYVITSGYVDVVVPEGNTVSEDDKLKVDLKENANLIKFIFLTPNNINTNDYYIYHFSDIGCVSGSFHDNYCTLGNQCLSGLNIGIGNGAITTNHDILSHCFGNEFCCSTDPSGCCS